MDLVKKYQDLRAKLTKIENSPMTCLKYLGNYELSSIESTFEEAKDSDKDSILEKITKTIKCFEN